METRVNAAGERQYLGTDGFWYSSEALATRTQQAPPAAAPVRGPSAPAKKKPRSPAAVGCMTILVVIVLAVIVTVIINAGGGGSGGGGKYTASFQAGGITAISPQEAQVFITVKNVGTGAGTPTCTINLESPSNTDLGVDVLTPVQPIAAHHEESYSDKIVVSGNGAQTVTIGASTVSC